AKHPDRIDVKVLRQFPELIAFLAPKAPKEGEPKISISDTDVPPPTITPEESIQQAESQILNNLRSEILKRISELSPSFFERLVVDLIVAMDYGGSRNSVAERIGKSGDEGIDGIINEDPLGLDVVYIQAKRYAADNTVGRERIQQFAGALVGQGASKGVF